MAAPYFISDAQFIGTIKLDFGSLGMDDSFATEVEENYLIQLLGYELYQSLIADLDSNGDPQTQKYIDLVDGVTGGYTDESGFKRRVEGVNVMLKYFFYDQYRRDKQTSQTTIGETDLTAINAPKVTGGLAEKIVYAYNQGVVHYCDLINFISFKNSSEGDDYYEHWEYKTLMKVNILGI